MNALTSINKPHTDNIFDGTKTIEWRKSPLPKTTHYAYETLNKGGCGKVIGQFDVVEIIKFNPLGDSYRPEWLAKGCVSIEDLIKYANGGIIYANVIENAKRFDVPKEVRDFHHINLDYTSIVRIRKAPQSWMYCLEYEEVTQ